MFCKMCGNEIKDTDKFCSYCGEKIQEKHISYFKIKRKYLWYGIYFIPILVFLILLVKINSITGHWYMINADKFSYYSDGFIEYYGPSQEIYFNSNDSFSDSDNGSILGTYTADKGILTLYYNNSSKPILLAYKVKHGKLHIYDGNKEYIYTRLFFEKESSTIVQTEILCINDNDIFLIEKTDIIKLTFVMDESKEPQYRYGIRIQLNDEKSKELKDFTTKHLQHDIEINNRFHVQHFVSIDNVIGDGNFFIAYFDSEYAARGYYDTLKLR